jgi:DMSO/TMAO reductase YedYZ molybdopterin-dependent catalytic subunit
MPEQLTRRDTFKKGLAAAGVLALVPDWALPALADDETEVPFTDLPKGFSPGANPKSPTRVYDIRKIDGPFTPKDQFFTLQHMNQPEIDPATYRLKLTGLVNKPAELSIDELRAMRPVEIAAGYECSGNSPRSVEGLSS